MNEHNTKGKLTAEKIRSNKQEAIDRDIKDIMKELPVALPKKDKPQKKPVIKKPRKKLTLFRKKPKVIKQVKPIEPPKQTEPIEPPEPTELTEPSKPSMPIIPKKKKLKFTKLVPIIITLLILLVAFIITQSCNCPVQVVDVDSSSMLITSIQNQIISQGYAEVVVNNITLKLAPYTG